jgi:hypothetical protein
VLVHITGGGLLQGTKLVLIKYKNSANSNSYRIFIKDGAVVFVTKYYKNIR